MTRKTILALLAQADDTLEDNVVGGITPADIRTMIKDVIDSFSPGYGAAFHPSVTMTALGTTSKPIPYTQQLAATTEFTVNLSAGQITRLALGLPTTVNRLKYQADVNAASGAEIQFTIFRNGAAIVGADTTITAQGVGNFSQAAVNVDISSLDGADYTYEVRVAKTTGAADNVQLTNARFVIEIIPTIGI